MGEIADEYIDNLSSDFDDGGPMPYAGWALPSRNWGWTTAQGVYVRICDAGTRHLINMARKLERENRAMTTDVYYPILAEIQRRKNAEEASKPKRNPILKF